MHTHGGVEHGVSVRRGPVGDGRDGGDVRCVPKPRPDSLQVASESGGYHDYQGFRQLVHARLVDRIEQDVRELGDTRVVIPFERVEERIERRMEKKRSMLDG